MSSGKRNSLAESEFRLNVDIDCFRGREFRFRDDIDLFPDDIDLFRDDIDCFREAKFASAATSIAVGRRASGRR
jgi:hypothetical protein